MEKGGGRKEGEENDMGSHILYVYVYTLCVCVWVWQICHMSSWVFVVSCDCDRHWHTGADITVLYGQHSVEHCTVSKPSAI